MSALSSIVDTDVTVKCAHPMSLNFEARGLDGIREKLVMDQHCQVNESRGFRSRAI